MRLTSATLYAITMRAALIMAVSGLASWTPGVIAGATATALLYAGAYSVETKELRR